MKPLSFNTLLFGGTGLVGQHVAMRASNPILCVNRRPISGLPDIHKEMLFDDLMNSDWPDSIDTVISCLGTTIKKAGSKASFKAQDFSLPKHLFEKAIKKGAKRLLLVTAVGSDPHSKIFYNQVKGLLEQVVIEQGWQQVIIFHPGLLMGERNESRLGETISQKILPFFDVIIPAKYRTIPGSKVADSIICHLQRPINSGITIVEGKSLWQK